MRGASGERQGEAGRLRSAASGRPAQRQPLGCSCGLMRARGRGRSGQEMGWQRWRRGSGVVFPL